MKSLSGSLTRMASGKGKFPERHFFYGIMYTVRTELTKAMIAEVIDRKIAEQ